MHIISGDGIRNTIIAVSRIQVWDPILACQSTELSSGLRGFGSIGGLSGRYTEGNKYPRKPGPI